MRHVVFYGVYLAGEDVARKGMREMLLHAGASPLVANPVEHHAKVGAMPEHEHHSLAQVRGRVLIDGDPVDLRQCDTCFV